MARHSTPLFTKRHYEWLAAFAARERTMLHYTPEVYGRVVCEPNEFQRGYRTAVNGIIARLARELRDTNGAFDETRFLAAAGTYDRGATPL